MGESSRNSKWPDTPFENADVRVLSAIITSQPSQDSLDKLYTYLKDENNRQRRKDAQSLFLYYLAKCNTNKPLKNDFMNKITNSREDFTLFSTIIAESVGHILLSFETQKSLLLSRDISHLLPVVNTYYQLCMDKEDEKLALVLAAISPLYNVILENFVQQLSEDFDATYSFENEEMISLANNAMKQVLWVFVKKPAFSMEEYVTPLLNYSYQVLSYENIGLDMKGKCALIFLHCLRKLPEEELVHFVFKDHPMLEITKDLGDPSEIWICGNTFKFKSLMHSNSARFVLLSSLFHCIPLEEQLTLILQNEKCVFLTIFEELLDCADRPMKDSGEIVEISRNLFLISESLSKVPPEIFESIFKKSLNFVNAFCDYHVDAVQKNATLFLGHVIRSACHQFRNGTESFIMHLLGGVNLNVGKRKIDFVTVMYLCTYMKCSFLLEKIPFLRDQVMTLLEDSSCQEHACTAYELLMREHYEELTLEEWLSIWVRPVLIQLRRVPLDKTPTYRRLLCRAFSVNQTILRDLFPNRYMGSHREWDVLLKCLCYARNSKTTLDITTYDADVYWWGLVEKTKLKMFSVQRDDMVRVSALKVIIECQRSTEAFSKWEFSFLIEYYLINGSNQVPHIRKEITSLYKKGITRFFGSIDVVRRKLESAKRKKLELAKRDPNPDEETEEAIKNLTESHTSYMEFLRNFITLLISNIAPDGNYYRRNSALDLLVFIQPMIDYALWETWWKRHDMENLVLILQDNYESNKKLALTILSKLRPEKFRFNDSNYYANYFSEALLFASDIKPSKSLSAAYMFQLCCYSPVLFESDEVLQNYGHENEMVLNIIILLASELLGKLNFENVGNIGDQSPCYGTLLCLRYLIRFKDRRLWNATYASTFSLIFTICQRLFRVVLPIVCNPAPEGYLPENEETEINIRDDTVRSQRILVYAWRTIKEITLLFAEFACHNLELRQHRVLSPVELLEIGEHFIQIFTQAKHRGVFEQAYVAFCIVCESLWKCNNRELNNLPKVLLRRGMDLVTGVRAANLCATRRSAGLPFLIMAIITTDPSLNRSSFHSTMSELMLTAASGNVEKIEFRVHSLNILRFLFRHAKLGDFVPPYIESSVELAIEGMRHFDWGVRNSSTLLFSALVTRLFGVQRTQDSEDVSLKNKMTFKVFCSRYPTLFKFLVDTLKEDCENNNSLVLQPILLIISRLYQSHSDAADVMVESLIPYIRKCMRISSFETRKLAARASLAVSSSKDLLATIEQNFEKLGHRELKNHECHAILQEVWYILKSVEGRLNIIVGKLIKESIHILERAGVRYNHHCVALYMNVLSFLFGRYNQRVDLDVLRRILTSISRLMEEKTNITGRHNFEPAMINLTITILLVRLEHVETTFQAINFDFENYLMVHQGAIMKTYCLHFVLYVNITYNEMDLQDPPLYTMEEVRPPNAVMEVINHFNKPTKCEFLTYIHKFMVGYLTVEMERMKNRSVNECFILNLLLLPYYPCLLGSLNNYNKQMTLDTLVNFCKCDREEVISAVITCVSVLISQIDNETLRSLNYRNLIRLLRRSASPDAAAYRRLAVCHFLLRCKFLYYSGTRFMRSTSVVRFLNMVMALLEDETIKIRNEISSITDDENVVLLDEQSKSGWKCCPDKSRYDFMKHCCKILPKPLLISFLMAWSIRQPQDVSNDSSDVFERSELNTFAENLPHAKISGKILSKILWQLPFNLNYEDKTIFMEEQCQMVTTIILDALNRHVFLIVNKKTKVSVICALKSILSFLDLNHINTNFKYMFTEYFRRKTLLFIQKQVCKRDYESVRKIFLLIYSPVLLRANL